MISVRFLGTQDTSRNKQHDDNVDAVTLVGHFKCILSDCLVVEQIILHCTFRKLTLFVWDPCWSTVDPGAHTVEQTIA